MHAVAANAGSSVVKDAQAAGLGMPSRYARHMACHPDLLDIEQSTRIGKVMQKIKLHSAILATVIAAALPAAAQTTAGGASSEASTATPATTSQGTSGTTASDTGSVSGSGTTGAGAIDASAPRDRKEGFNPGWLGLLGLIGLVGMKRRDPYGANRSTGTTTPR
jgi:hypothetical protein